MGSKRLLFRQELSREKPMVAEFRRIDYGPALNVPEFKSLKSIGRPPVFRFFLHGESEASARIFTERFLMILSRQQPNGFDPLRVIPELVAREVRYALNSTERLVFDGHRFRQVGPYTYELGYGYRNISAVKNGESLMATLKHGVKTGAPLEFSYPGASLDPMASEQVVRVRRGVVVRVSSSIFKVEHPYGIRSYKLDLVEHAILEGERPKIMKHTPVVSLALNTFGYYTNSIASIDQQGKEADLVRRGLTWRFAGGSRR